MADPSIASVQGSAIVRSLSVGETQLVVRDHQNYHNWASITVEVANMHSFEWVEEQAELRASEINKQGEVTGGEQRILSLTALDYQGRKFTNCTAVDPDYSVKGDDQVSLEHDYFKTMAKHRHSKYDLVKQYIRDESNRNLLLIK